MLEGVGGWKGRSRTVEFVHLGHGVRMLSAVGVVQSVWCSLSGAGQRDWVAGVMECDER